jgi:hypothetical protein
MEVTAKDELARNSCEGVTVGECEAETVGESECEIVGGMT